MDSKEEEEEEKKLTTMTITVPQTYVTLHGFQTKSGLKTAIENDLSFIADRQLRKLKKCGVM